MALASPWWQGKAETWLPGGFWGFLPLWKSFSWSSFAWKAALVKDSAPSFSSHSSFYPPCVCRDQPREIEDSLPEKLIPNCSISTQTSKQYLLVGWLGWMVWVFCQIFLGLPQSWCPLYLAAFWESITLQKSLNFWAFPNTQELR